MDINRRDPRILNYVEQDPRRRVVIEQALQQGYSKEELVPYLQKGLQRTIDVYRRVQAGDLLEDARGHLKTLDGEGFDAFFQKHTLSDDQYCAMDG